ncbi:hypothetical protein GGI43DRAFT_386325 [Trichoderma evansii]
MDRIQSIIALNKAICAEINERKEYTRVIASGTDDFPIVEGHQNYILQSLFQVLLIIIHPRDWNGEDSSLIGGLPVTIVRTGVENGLSSPITFESIVDKIYEYTGENAIKTTLETAIDFVMGLETRETRAFGLQPDPTASWNPDVCLYQWRDLMPYDQLIGPTTRFVDTEKNPQRFDREFRAFDESFAIIEQREIRRYAQWRSQQQS